jgi:hypothetical protein
MVVILFLVGLGVILKDRGPKANDLVEAREADL